MNKGFRIIAILLSVVLISCVTIADFGYNYYTISAGKNEKETKSKGLNIAYRTQDEIRAFVKSHPVDFNAPVEYDEEPLDIHPYSLGKVKDKTLKSALNALNQMRYIAGLQANVTLNSKYTKLAQAASVVNYANKSLSHFPSKPSGMSKNLYSLGAEGSSKSNIAMGYNNIDTSIVYAYMEDGDASNIATLGHRRWILNPSMKSTGFGFYDRFSATYAFDMSRTSASEYGVIWPAKNMPVIYFNNIYPWSISMGYTVDASKIKIKLTRLSDNKTWNFRKSKSDGYFNVNNDYYGQVGCIIFRPKKIEGYKAGDIFNVTITGLKKPISYEVSFFDL